MRQKLIVFFLLCLAAVLVSGQGLIVPELPLPDTAGNNSGDFFDEKLPAFNLTPGGLIFPGTALFNPELVKLPGFDFNESLLNFRQDYSYLIYNPEGVNSTGLPFVANPFIHSAAVFNQAAYKISGRLLFGGNSFGANSIFTAPLPNQGLNRFNTRGASMFFQYKVSKNIKIETRVSVTGNQF